MAFGAPRIAARLPASIGASGWHSVCMGPAKRTAMPRHLRASPPMRRRSFHVKPNRAVRLGRSEA